MVFETQTKQPIFLPAVDKRMRRYLFGSVSTASWILAEAPGEITSQPGTRVIIQPAPSKLLCQSRDPAKLIPTPVLRFIVSATRGAKQTSLQKAIQRDKRICR